MTSPQVGHRRHRHFPVLRVAVTVTAEWDRKSGMNGQFAFWSYARRDPRDVRVPLDDLRAAIRE